MDRRDSRRIESFFPAPAQDSKHMTLWRIGIWFDGRLLTILVIMALGLVPADGRGVAQEVPEPSSPTTVPLRPPPSPQERILSPVPQQFDWMRRVPPANPLLESLVAPQPVESRLLFSLTLSGEYSDNFRDTGDGGGESASKDNVRTALTFGTLYHREHVREERTQSFLSLANTISAHYDTSDGNTDIGFTNLTLNSGYTWPRLSFAVSDNLVLDDDRFRYTQGLESNRRRFLSNRLSPQMRYAFSRLSSMTLGYTNDIEVDLEVDKVDSVTHRITPGFQYRFSRVVDSSISYTLSHVDRRLEGENELSHNVVTNLGWALSTHTSFLFTLDILLIDRDQNRSLAATADRSSTVQLSAGVNQQLSPSWSLFVSAGPIYVSRTIQVSGIEDENQDIFVHWEARLSGQIASQTSLAFTSSQHVDNTSGTIADRGLVLRTAVGSSLSHTFTPNLHSALSIDYGRNDPLENIASDDPSQSRKDQFVIARLSGTYVFTPTLSLLLRYQYEQRFSKDDTADFRENRVTLALSASF
jgi:adhesin HecA-like repeat protein